MDFTSNLLKRLPTNLLLGSLLTFCSLQAVASQIAAIDFQRTSQGNAQLLLDFAAQPGEARAEQSEAGLTLTFDHTQIAPELINLYDTSDFATLVTSLSLDQINHAAQVSLSVDRAFSYLTYQDDNQLIVEISPQAVTEELPASRRFRYTGEPITLNYRDIPVRQLLGELASFLDLNLVAGDNVQGNITLQLSQVPSDQALDIILTTQNLASRQVGNVLLVAPTSELLALEQEQFEATQAEETLAPLVDEFIRINYARAADIRNFIMGDRADTVATQIQARGFLSDQGSINIPASDRRFMTDRGHLMVDERTNTLYVRDTEEQVERIRSIVRTLDVPIDQIMIEARIVVARTGVSEELGVSWGLGGTDTGRFDLGSPNLTTQSGNRGLAIDFGGLGDATRSSGIGFGYVSNNILLDLELAALETENRSEIISQPKVITSDRVRATIRSGEQIPYRKVEDGTVSVEFQDAELRLEVVPHITRDGRILMDLTVNNDSKGELTADGYAINSNSVETQVLANDGETIVIGGIFTSQSQEATAKTPFFGDLPLVGWMFRRNYQNTERVELLIFITPTMLQTGRFQQAVLDNASRQMPAATTEATSGSSVAAAAPVTVAATTATPARTTQQSVYVDEGLRRDAWIMQQPGEAYALQIMGHSDEEKVRDFILSQPDSLNLVYFETRHEGNPWYVVIYGKYDTREEAQAAIASLPLSLQQNQPWARSFRVFQRLIETH